jgi:predicted metalloprotease
VRTRLLRRAGALLAGLALLAGCGSAIAGTPTRDASGNGAATGPSGPKANPPAANLTVVGDAHTEWDVQAENTIADLYAYYRAIFPKDFPGKTFAPASQLVSYDSTDKSAKECDTSVYQSVNAAYDPSCNSISWDRGVLMPQMARDVGNLAVPTILAHEMGHLVQHLLGVSYAGKTVVMLEQQADCYAGSYWRWVADGNSKYYDLNQGDGMRQVLTAMMHTADPVGMTAAAAQAHGSGFDRTLAFSLGYTNGATRCNQIDQQEVDQRIKETGFTTLPKNFDNVPVDASFLGIVTDTVNTFFGQQVPNYRKPTLETFDGATAPSCAGQPGSFPVTYCGATNTVSYNAAELQRIATPTKGFDSTNGDFSAVLLVVSRYGLAALNPTGNTTPTGDNAGLRALCYAGAWANWMRSPQGPKKLQLSPNDLDKAVYEVMSSSLPASDGNGKTGTVVIDQVQAFYIGVVQGMTTCFDNYS